MSASDQLNGRHGTDDLETLLFGVPMLTGFDQAASVEDMPDFNNVMPTVPDHVPDSLSADVESDARA